MKKYLSLVLVAVIATTVLADKPQLKPYGFLKGDFYATTAGVSSWGDPNITAASSATGTSKEAIAFSAAHSRFGLKGSADVDNATIGGVLELDFFSTTSNTNANANPRMRLAYAWVKLAQMLTINCGQQWDLFSPLNPTTNNTNANLWYNGNYGFRRPQFQVRLDVANESFAPGIHVSVGEGAKETAGLALDNLSRMPMIQARLLATMMKKVTFGVSGFVTAFGEDRDATSSGLSVDLSAPIHKLFALTGEFAYGSNMNDANLFVIQNKTTVGNDVENVGFWVNVTSKPADFLHIVAGVANEVIVTEVTSGLEKNFTAYGDLIFPIGKFFSLAVEYQFLMSTPKGMDAYTASVIDIAGKVSF